MGLFKIKCEAIRPVFAIFVTYYLVRPILFSAMWIILLPQLRQSELLSTYLGGLTFPVIIAAILTLLLMNTKGCDVGSMVGGSILVLMWIYMVFYNTFCESLALNELLYQSQNRKSAVLLAWFLEVLSYIAMMIYCESKLKSHDELNGLTQSLMGVLPGAVFMAPALCLIYEDL